MATEGEKAAMSPQEQQLLQYLEDLQQTNPAEYDMIVKDMQEKAAAQGKPVPGGGQQGEQVTPTPGFVVKTRSFTRKGAKVFINVCSSDHVDKPAPVEGHDNAEEVQMRIPLSLGPPREDLDKSGEVCTVYDVVFHPDAVEGALKEEEFRSFVMQLTAHQIKQKCEDEISLEMSFPKVKGNYKGIAPLPQFMRKKGTPPPPPPGSEPKEGAATDGADGAAADGSAAKPKVMVEELAGPSAEALPAPSYCVEARRFGSGSGDPDGLCFKCHLPTVEAVDEVQLEVSTELVEMLVADTCRLSLQLPLKVALPPLKASFETERHILTLHLKADAVAGGLDGGLDDSSADPSSSAAAAGAGGAGGGAGGGAAADPELSRREREREARLNARRRRAAGNKQLERQAEADAAAAEAPMGGVATEEGAVEEGGAADAGDAADTGGATDAAAEGGAEDAAKAKAAKAPPPSGALELSNSIMFELED